MSGTHDHNSHDGADPHPHHQHVHETASLHDAPDAWHDHAADEKPMHAHAEVGNARAIIFVGFGLFMLIVFSVIVVYGYYTLYTTRRLAEEEVVHWGDMGAPAIQARQYKQSSLIAENQYGWVAVPPPDDKTPGRVVVRLPISVAEQKVLKEYKVIP